MKHSCSEDRIDNMHLSRSEFAKQWYKSLEPIILLRLVLGLETSTFQETEFKQSSFALAYCVLVMLLFIAEFIIVVMWHTLLKAKVKSLVELIQLIFVVTNSFMAILKLGFVCSTRNKAESSNRTMQWDYKLHRSGVNFDFEKTKKQCEMAISITLVSLVVINGLDYVIIFYLSGKATKIKLSLFVITKVLSVFNILIFVLNILVIYQLSARFEMIQNEVLKMIKYRPATSNIIEKVNFIKKAHRAYVKLVKMFVGRNSATTFVLLMSRVIAIICQIYAILDLAISWIERTTPTFDWAGTIYNLYWALISLCQVVLLAKLCDNIASRANNLGVLVHQLIGSGNYKAAEEELKAFSLELMHNKLEITAGGITTLNGSFLEDVCGKIISYLIILIQVRMTGLKAASVENAFSF